MRVLVTGAAGFIGFNLSRHLLTRGDEVLGIDSLNDYYDVTLKHARLGELAKSGDGLGGGFAFKQVDFSDHVALETALGNEDFDRIVHLGAQAGVRYSIENPRAYLQANLAGHLNMLEIARHRRT
ncbi:MAG: NAD-dependent epimerase/dehydratase family protein, partial [Alphaproteobacteria bacterium]